MKRSKSQTSLLTIWLKKDTTSTDTSSFQSAGGDSSEELFEDKSLADSNSECTEISEDQTRQKSRLDLDVSKCGSAVKSCVRCNDNLKAYHWNEGTILSLFARKGHKFLPT